MTLIYRNSIFPSRFIERKLNTACEIVKDWLYWLFGMGEKLDNALIIESLAVTLLAAGLILSCVKVYWLKHPMKEKIIHSEI